MDYTKYHGDLRKNVDFVFDLHNCKSKSTIDKYSKFMAYSLAIKLDGNFFSIIRLSIKIYLTFNKILCIIKIENENHR